jgi:hypothetical protein
LNIEKTTLTVAPKAGDAIEVNLANLRPFGIEEKLEGVMFDASV